MLPWPHFGHLVCAIGPPIQLPGRQAVQFAPSVPAWGQPASQEEGEAASSGGPSTSSPNSPPSGRCPLAPYGAPRISPLLTLPVPGAGVGPRPPWAQATAPPKPALQHYLVVAPCSHGWEGGGGGLEKLLPRGEKFFQPQHLRPPPHHPPPDSVQKNFHPKGTPHPPLSPLGRQTHLIPPCPPPPPRRLAPPPTQDYFSGGCPSYHGQARPITGCYPSRLTELPGSQSPHSAANPQPYSLIGQLCASLQCLCFQRQLHEQLLLEIQDSRKNNHSNFKN